jgi:hypothetical protein
MLWPSKAVSGVPMTTDRILANCFLAGSVTNSQITYYDGNFALLGATYPSAGSVAVTDAPESVPATLKVGDSGSIGAQTVYLDSTRTQVYSRTVSSYAVQAETSTTAILVVTDNIADATGTHVETRKTSYQLRNDGTYVLLSIDEDIVKAPAYHLIYTPATVATTLAAGQTVTLAAGQMLLVPAGTTVTSGTNSSSLQGQLNTVSAAAGAVVSVPANATGPADNVVMAH